MYIVIHLVVDVVLCFSARMWTKDVMTLYSWHSSFILPVISKPTNIITNWNIQCSWWTMLGVTFIKQAEKRSKQKSCQLQCTMNDCGPFWCWLPQPEPDCWQNYVDYLCCLKVMEPRGEDTVASCTYFNKLYKSLCFTEWTKKWYEQIENNTFPLKI